MDISLKAQNTHNTHGPYEAKKKEIEDNPNSILNFGDMVLKKFGISAPAGTVIEINGKEIPLFTGVFELGMNQIDITSLVFPEAVSVNIYYMF